MCAEGGWGCSKRLVSRFGAKMKVWCCALFNGEAVGFWAHFVFGNLRIKLPRLCVKVQCSSRSSQRRRCPGLSKGEYRRKAAFLGESLVRAPHLTCDVGLKLS